MMKTVIYQSFRKDNVPAWIKTCMLSVKSWALQKNFYYHVIHDEMFDLVPLWYKKKTNHQIHLMTDLARLLKANQLLNQGYDQAIWVDADVFVFCPIKFTLPTQESYAFCKERYVGYDDNGKLSLFNRTNNAITLMSKGNDFLPFYIKTIESIVLNKTNIRWTSVGTDFLSHLNSRFPIDKIQNLGLFSPIIIHDISLGEGKALELFLNSFNTAIYAANLCLTFYNTHTENIHLTEKLLNSAMNQLRQKNGKWINEIKH